jgi:hypothetical protein
VLCFLETRDGDFISPEITGCNESGLFHARFPVFSEAGLELFAALPSHARPTTKTFPHWKELFIKQNREFYQQHQR